MSRRARVVGITLLALIPSAHLAWQARDMPHLGHYHDDGIYWVSAKSLADGAGYRIASLPDRPYQTKYPPLYPLLLSGIWRLEPSFPGNLRWAVLFAWLALPVCLALTRLVFQDLGLGWSPAWLLCAALAVNPTVVILSISLMSDLVFCCLLFASLCLVTRAAKPKSPSWLVVAAGLLGGAAFLTRSAAWPLVLAAPLWFALRKNYSRAGLYAAAMAPAVVGWTLWMKSHLTASSDPASLYYTNYIGWQLYNISWSNLLTILSNNLYFLISAISDLIVYNTGPSFWGGFFWRLWAFAAVAGVIRLIRSAGLTPYHLFSAGFVPLLLLCNWPPDERLVLPMFPLLLAGLYVELRHVVDMARAAFHRPDRANRAVAGLVTATLAAFAAAGLYYTYDALFRFLPAVVARHRQQRADEAPGYRWVAENIPPNDAFLAYDDPVFYLYTGHPAVSIPVPTKVFYREGRGGVERLFASPEDFVRQYRLKGLWSTSLDFYRGELTGEGRNAVQKSLEASGAFRRVYQSTNASVLLIEPL